ncbi:MAG: hypothetical protein WCG26_15230, partial [Chloroflexales bacterium]
MNHTIRTSRTRRQQCRVARLLAVALLPLLLGCGCGHVAESLPAAASALTRTGTVRWVRRCPWQRPARTARVWPLARRVLRPVLAQAGLLALLLGANRVAPPLFLLASLPVLRAVLTCSALVWPRWGQGARCRWLAQTSADLHLALVFTLSVGLVRDHLLTSGILAVAAAVPRAPKPSASGRIRDDGTDEVVLGDQFAIRHPPVDEFDRRMFLLFLRDIHLVQRPSQWPFICQVWLANWFGTLQELISRWEDYREAGDWPRLMRRHDGPLLPWAQRQTLIHLWARHLWWSRAEVQAAAAADGLALSADAITQIGQESGLLVARRVLRERFQRSAETLRPKDGWLVGRLFAQIDQLQAHLDAGTPPTVETQADLDELLTLREELGLGTGRELEKPLPWASHMQHILCGNWEPMDDGVIRCPHCGSTQVRRKSRTPRTKRYVDAHGQPQTVEVFRYRSSDNESGRYRRVQIASPRWQRRIMRSEAHQDAELFEMLGDTAIGRYGVSAHNRVSGFP